MTPQCTLSSSKREHLQSRSRDHHLNNDLNLEQQPQLIQRVIQLTTGIQSHRQQLEFSRAMSSDSTNFVCEFFKNLSRNLILHHKSANSLLNHFIFFLTVNCSRVKLKSNWSWQPGEFSLIFKFLKNFRLITYLRLKFYWNVDKIRNQFSDQV